MVYDNECEYKASEVGISSASGRIFPEFSLDQNDLN
jgi:hypothetical protein